MAKVKSIARPKGQSPDYKFFKNDETGSTFKAKVAQDENIAKQPVIRVSVSQTDATGKAILAEGATEPDIVWHTHVVTQEEMRDPSFDPDARFAAIMDAVITDQENIMRSKEKLNRFFK